MKILYFIFSLFMIQEQLLVPIDHQLANSKKIPITYSIVGEFNESKETIFLLEDPLDLFHDTLNQTLGLEEKWNVVKIHGRQHSPEIKRLVYQNGDVNWESAYRFYNQRQVAFDLEYLREKILGDQKVILLGHSSSGAGLLQYLSLFPEKVSKCILRSPLIFDIQNNVGFSTEILKFNQTKNTLDGPSLFYFSTRTSLDFTEFTDEECEDTFFSSFSYPNFQYGLLDSISLEEIAIQVRIFEHSHAFSSQKYQQHPLAQWMKKASSDLWSTYNQNPFPTYGTKYNQIAQNQVKVLILAGKFDLLINYHSYEVLAEFFSNSETTIINDGHGLSTLKTTGILARLSHAFLANDVEQKVSIFEEMKKLSLYPTKK